MAGDGHAQCCGGWQDQSFPSRDKTSVIKVEALRGRRSHGPFRFKFSWLKRGPEGDYRLAHEFEADVDAQTCSSASVIPSPLGNGFLLRFWSLAAFYAADGTHLFQLRSLVAGGSGNGPISDESVLSADGFTVQLHKPKVADGVLIAEPAGRLFLPLGIAVGGAQEQELLTLLEEGWAGFDRRRKEFETLPVRLADDAIGVREQAQKEILAQHAFAITLVQDALTKTPSVEAKARLESVLSSLPVWRQAGGVTLLRDLRLLASLLSYPDERVAKAAKRHLLSILPEATVEDLRDKGPSEWWTWANQEPNLVWDETRRRYRSK